MPRGARPARRMDTFREPSDPQVIDRKGLGACYVLFHVPRSPFAGLSQGLSQGARLAKAGGLGKARNAGSGPQTDSAAHGKVHNRL